MNIPLTPIRFLRYAREQFPHKTAVVCRDQRFTYAQFAERAGRLAGALQALGATPGDRVAFLTPNCHRLMEAYFGVLEAGCVLMPMNTRVAPHELAYMLNDACPKFLFLETQFTGMIDSICQEILSVEKFVLLDGNGQTNWLAHDNYEDLLSASPEIERNLDDVDENSVAEIFYTNGGASQPKGVMLTHRNIYLHAMSVLAAYQTAKATAGQASCESVQLHCIPLFHSNGWGAVHTITQVGGTHVLMHNFNPAEVFRVIERERVTAFGMVPAMATALINSPVRTKCDLRSLKYVMVGGAASSAALVRDVEEKLGCACMSGYGLTECSPVLAMSPMKGDLRWEGPVRHARQAKTGFAIPGVEIRVVNSEGKDVPHDGETIGEIIARGDGIMEGYWNQPEATQTVMERGWFRTGDVATIDANNYLQIVDRKKDIIISGGENISALELEKTIAEHPSVHEVAVIPAPDERWGEIPVALVVVKPGMKATATELMQLCRARLSRYKCPRSFEFLDTMPKDEKGKIMKNELRKRFTMAMKAAA